MPDVSIDVLPIVTRSSRLSAILAGALVLLASLCPPHAALAQSAAATPPAAASADYSDPALWLCRPGRADVCAANLDATIIAEDGSMTKEAFHADPDAPIDCFYLYPTVSREPTGNADFAIDADVSRPVVQEFARFGGRCRLFAPVYRQFTLAWMRSYFSGKPIPMSFDLAYNDVLAAWKTYLADDNHGRGFVLVGHSQGAILLAKLVREEIDGKPVQAQMVSAFLIGEGAGDLAVKRDATTPLPFPHIPVCRANTDVGCVIGFASFRAETPPAPNTLFEKAPEGSHPVCANPAALEGGAAPLDAYLSASGGTIMAEANAPFEWTNPGRPIDTPFVKVPGLLSASCVDDGDVVYLAVSRTPSKDGHRASDITGDAFGASGKVLTDFGLHIVDLNLTMGNLLAVVGDETRAYLAKAKKD